MHHIARYGASGAAEKLPFLDTIQKSFGGHDISGIQAHGDRRAGAAAQALHANAFTSGLHVGFARPPSLRTAAHEATHVIQQRAGIHLAGGIGGVRDEHERHADAVANRVVRGESSQPLLDNYVRRASPGRTAGDALQLEKADSAFGTFETVTYKKLTNTEDAEKEIGCEIYLTFEPNERVNATKIAFTQAVKATADGKMNTPPDKNKQAATSGAGKDSYIDQYAGNPNPLYIADFKPADHPERMGDWKTNSAVRKMTKDESDAEIKGGVKGSEYTGHGQHGFHKKNGDKWETQNAQLHDRPRRPKSTSQKDVVEKFETAALAIEGAQTGTYYGSVQWGWQRDNPKDFHLLDFKLVSMGTPSAVFMGAAQQWNKSTTYKKDHTAGEATMKLPTVEVWSLVADTKVKLGAERTLPTGTRVRVVAKGSKAADPWTVEIVDGPGLSGKDIGKQTQIASASLKQES